MRRQQHMSLDDRIIPYLQMAGLYHFAKLNETWFRLDEPLVGVFMGRVKPDLFEELLGVLPPTNCINKFTVKCTWMQETFSELSQDADDATLFDDKSGLHIRWLLYAAKVEDMGRYDWRSTTLS
ncbi:hypothetical protein Ahy_A10g050667 [Arachis hypogaea]|uniref:Aminotransferase-like plant mobile domain-containing protein n=1 Tax=Arachis hypogaea TaxID=3818 RepID=A0A445BA39_ARAHY|nr:hypothetical protein Ahy_A10g050667 [Arachis hypogaea]